MKPGLSVEECVRRLKRYHYAFKRLHQIFTARITAEPIYELKMGFSLHAHLCAEHVAALRKRVGEMREPPLGLEAVPDPNLEIFFDEILGAPTTEELVLGPLREGPAGAEGRARTASARTPIRWPTIPRVRLCRFALLELEDMLQFGAQSIAALVDDGLPRARWRLAGAAGRLPGRRRRAGRHADAQSAKTARAPALRQALPVRPRPAARRALSRSLQHGRQRRGLSLRRAVPARAEDADDVLQAAARDRRAGDDGQHHHRDARQAVGLLPRHDPPALGRGAPRDDGRGRLRQSRHRLAASR